MTRSLTMTTQRESLDTLWQACPCLASEGCSAIFNLMPHMLPLQIVRRCTLHARMQRLYRGVHMARVRT